MQSRNRDPDVENKHMDTKEGRQVAKPVYRQWVLVKENTVFITGKKNKQLMLKDQNSLMVFRQRILKTVLG